MDVSPSQCWTSTKVKSEGNECLIMVCMQLALVTLPARSWEGMSHVSPVPCHADPKLSNTTLRNVKMVHPYLQHNPYFDIDM